MIVEHAASHSNKVLTDIERRLAAASIPGNCQWSEEEVKSGGWLTKTRRDFLLIRLDQFSDYRIYAAARSYGAHLDVCRFLTIEPGRFKKWLSEHVSSEGTSTALSAPKNILIAQDLRAWVTVVHRCVVGAVEGLVSELGQDKNQIRRESKGFLQVW